MDPQASIDFLRQSLEVLNGGPRVLLVEDDQDDASLMFMELLKFQCKPQLVSDSDLAKELLKTEKFDLIITDIKMPTSVTELLEAIVRDGLSTKALAVTGYPGSPYAEAVLSAGALCVVPKPLTEKFLSEFLRRKID